MKSAIVAEGFYVKCRHCKHEFDLLTAKRKASKFATIKCPSCKKNVESEK